MNLPNPENAVGMTVEHYSVQSAFVSAYLKDFSTIKAARAIGYTGTTPGKKGEAILAWPGTRALIQAELSAVAANAKISKAWALSELVATYEESKHAEVPKPMESAKILDMIIKHAGLEDTEEKNELVIKIKQFHEIEAPS